MKIVNYRCPECGFDHEEWVQDTADSPETLSKEDIEEEELCECECDLVKFNYKNNCQVWKYLS